MLRKFHFNNNFKEFESYVWSNILYGTDTISVNQEWFDNNESILKIK